MWGTASSRLELLDQAVEAGDLRTRPPLYFSPASKGLVVASVDFSQLTAIITTSDRPKNLRRLVRSAKRLYPQLQILVADDGLVPAPDTSANHLRLPVGVGRSAACNALLARIRTRYFLLLDDRCELHRDTRLERLLQLVAEDKLDLAAGDLTGCLRKFWLHVRRSPQPGHGLLDFDGDHLTLTPGHRTIGDGFLWCDLVHNFYIARTDKVRSLGGWDPELKMDEREEFFVRAHRQGLRVGLAPDVNAWVWTEPMEEPLHDLKSLAVAKMGVT